MLPTVMRCINIVGEFRNDNLVRIFASVHVEYNTIISLPLWLSGLSFILWRATRGRPEKGLKYAHIVRVHIVIFHIVRLRIRLPYIMR